MNLVNKVLIFLLTGSRPLLGPAYCKFAISCTDFAVIQLQEHNTVTALWNIAKRLAHCSPLI